MSDPEPAPPEPPVAQLVRCMVVFSDYSGLPSNRFVNTFHFKHPGGLITAALSASPLATEIRKFYEAVNAPALTSVGEYLARYLSRTYELRFYDMSVASGERVPYVRAGGLPSPANVAQDLPNETALCLSLSGELPATPRERGRMNIGPFNVQAADLNAYNLPNRPNPGLVDAVRYAADKLADNVKAIASGYEWVIYSRATDSMVPIKAGYVDDSWDTMRKRGVEATSRLTFGVV